MTDDPRWPPPTSDLAAPDANPPADAYVPGPAPDDDHTPGTVSEAERRELEALGEEIAAFAARVDAAQHALLVRLREFDARGGWAIQGCLSAAHWLSWRTSMSLTTARERVRVARALGDLPKLDAAFAKGEVSYSKARAITRVATPDTEQPFVDLAPHATAAQLDKICRTHHRVHRDDANPTERLSARRFARRWCTPDGMVRVEFQGLPEEGEVLWTAIETATELPVSSQDASAEDSPQDASAEDSPHDASAEDSPHDASAEDSPHDASAEAEAGLSVSQTIDLENRRADAVLAIAESFLQAKQRKAGGSSFELIVVSTPEGLQAGSPAGAQGPGGFLVDGAPLAREAARMIGCDCGVVDATATQGGSPLDVGRRRRTIGPALRRALRLRDRGCAFPGCTASRHIDGHHIVHWADGGGTNLDNLVLLCRRHHAKVHDGAFEVSIRNGRPDFSTSHGRAMPQVPPTATSGNDLEDLDAFIDRDGPGLSTLGAPPRWNGDPLDIDETMDRLPP